MATPSELGLAFGLVLAAGAATAVGASAVFFTNQANHKVLAASLGVSAGVMIYVSFLEIFASKAVQGFEDAGFTAAESTRYATLSFFGGMLLLWLLDKLVHGILHIISSKSGQHHGQVPSSLCCDKSKAPMLVTLQQVTQKHGCATINTHNSSAATAHPHQKPSTPSGAAPNTPGSCTHPPTTAADLPSHAHGPTTALCATTNTGAAATTTTTTSHPKGHAMALGEIQIRAPSVTTMGAVSMGSLVHRHPYSVPDHELTGAEAAAHVVLRMHESAARLSHPEEGMGRASHVASTTVAVLTEEVVAAHAAQEREREAGGSVPAGPLAGGEEEAEEGGARVRVGGAAGKDDDAASNAAMLEKHRKQQHQAKLSRMGLLAAMAIGLHNLPEGLATFVGALADPTAGVVIAIAIALHNIPEGVVVAMPIAYASGSKLKGFMWGCLSGATEPIGALLGYAILGGGSQELNPLVYALLFGLVAGMMVWISVSELLPTAFRYDPDDTVTTWSVAAGMVVMAASLLLFEVK